MLEQAIANQEAEYARRSREWKAGRADIMSLVGIQGDEIEAARRVIALAGVSNFDGHRPIGNSALVAAATAAMDGIVHGL